MEHDNMIGNPNQKTPTSVFGFDPYPGTNTTFPWDTSSQQLKYPSEIPRQMPDSPIFPNYVPPHQISPPVAPQIPSSFSFTSQPSTSTMGGQFPFQITTHELGERSFKLIHGKRKNDSPSLQPCKQHITEEKMAEHMSRLHISSETATSSLEPESVRNKRLYMCHEMRKLQAEPIIPPCLLSSHNIERPCTALVLWQPPSKILTLEEGESDSTDSNNEDARNTRPANYSFRNLEPIEIDSDSLGNIDEMEA